MVGKGWHLDSGAPDALLSVVVPGGLHVEDAMPIGSASSLPLAALTQASDAGVDSS